MKILHTGDWHLDSPLQGHELELRQTLGKIPEKILEVCQKEACDLVLLSGDLFDGAYSVHTYRVLYTALAEMAVPVFMSPGNHDFCGSDSPWKKEIWPENVHIFQSNL